MSYRRSLSSSSDDSNEVNETDSHSNGFSNIFRNDGSFLEMFKKMQNASRISDSNNAKVNVKTSVEVKAESLDDEIADQNSSLGSKQPAPHSLPLVGRRRGMKVLPVGKVKKLKTDNESNKPSSNDAWAKYLEEVKKYKETYCDGEMKNRSLVK